ncbi:MAG: DUF4157 domain-containing protein [Deltaproteobacteria bacterium]|nr:DUF4157 domain-containing protein [Deltaproteobacteria bacterium]
MSHDHERQSEGSPAAPQARAHDASVGKTSTSSLLRRPANPVPSGLLQRAAAPEPEPEQEPEQEPVQEPVQEQDAAVEDAQEEEAPHDGGAHDTARRGFAGPARALPHLATIQTSFGKHDVSGVQAHVGGPAAEASDALGAEAYAMGNSVAFRDEPDLFTAAHEAAHVVQQRRGVQLAGGVGRAGDAYEQHADAVAHAVVQGESAEELLGELSGGGSAEAGIQRWVAGEPKMNTESSILKPFVRTEIGVTTPPNIILSQYKNAYTPRIFFNISGSFLGPRGNLYAHFDGAVARRALIEKITGEWNSPAEVNITKDMLVDPGRGKAYSDASLYAEYSAPLVLEPGVDAKSPVVHIQSYHDAFAGTGPERSKTGMQLDIDNKHLLRHVSNTTKLVIAENWGQQTAVETATSTNVKFAQTLTSQATTSLIAGGKGSVGGGGKPGGELNFGFNQQWTRIETESYENAAGSGWKETTGATRAFTVSDDLPAYFKGTYVLYPFVQQRLDWVESRLHDGQGQVLGSHMAHGERRWVGFNIPNSHAAVLGVDPAYAKVILEMFYEYRRQYYAAQAIERRFNGAAVGPTKLDIGGELDVAKSGLVDLGLRLQSLQPNIPASIEDADTQIRRLAAPSKDVVKSSDSNMIIAMWKVYEVWSAYASASATGAGAPSAPTAAPTTGK